jgi:hypothetical protein
MCSRRYWWPTWGITVLIIRACQDLGIKTVAVYSEADRDCLHTLLADEKVCLPGFRETVPQPIGKGGRGPLWSSPFVL